MLNARAGLSVLTAVFATAAFAGVGSVISSFVPWLNYRESTDSLYRDASYVYGIMHDQSSPRVQIYIYTPSGSFVGGGPWLHPPATYEDADHSVLGSGYFAINFGRTAIEDIAVATGSVVSSWSPSSNIRGYAYAPGGEYKYAAERSVVGRYTSAGSPVSSFYTNGAASVAVTDMLGGVEGEYVICASGATARVYTGSGSQLRSFRLWSGSENFAAVCGPGFPAACRDTYWCLQVCEPGAYQMERIFQISLGNGVAVEPASVGKIKALFR